MHAPEQTFASVAAFIMKTQGGGVQLYLDDVRENFKHPSVWIPPPEIDTAGDTLTGYKATYVAYVAL